MKRNFVTVLDLGSTKVACLAATPDSSDGIEIIGAAVAECKGVKRGVVTDLEETSSAIRSAVRQVQQTVGEEITALVVGVGGAHMEGQNSQGFVPIYPKSRQVTREDVLQVINHSRQLMIPANREQIQALPREFRIDGQRGIQRPIGMSGAKLEVTTYLVTGETTHVQNVEKAIEMAGCQVDHIVLQPLASGLGVLTPEEMELGSAVVDIGGGTTEIAVFANGSIVYSASIPIGGQLVTSDVSKLLKTSVDEAERLKLESGCASAEGIDEDESVDVLQLGHTQPRPLQRRVLCEIIEARMRELAQLVRQHIEKSGVAGVLPGGLILTGGGSRLPDLDKFFTQQMKHLAARVAEPQVSGAFGNIGEKAGMASATGLARFALQCAEDEFSTAESGNWKERIRTFWSILGGKG